MTSISFLVPVYNVDKYLCRCLDSVYSQIQDTQSEVILVDDGSEDDSGSICDIYKARYPNQTTLYHKQHEGISSTRNFLLEHATKDYIWFVDADDMLQSNALKQVNAMLDTNNHPDVVTMCYKSFDDERFSEIKNNPALPNEIISGLHYLELKMPCSYLWCNVYNLKFINRHFIHFKSPLSVLEDSLFNLEVYLQAKSVMLTSICAYNHFVGNPESAVNNPAYCLRNAAHSLIAINEIQHLREGLQDERQRTAVDNQLSMTVIGFVYSLFVANFDVKIVRVLLNKLRKLNFYPMSKSNNKRANVFRFIGNRYNLFCAACWIKNKLHPNTMITSDNPDVLFK